MWPTTYKEIDWQRLYKGKGSIKKSQQRQKLVKGLENEKLKSDHPVTNSWEIPTFISLFIEDLTNDRTVIVIW